MSVNFFSLSQFSDPQENYQIMRKAMIQRAALVPYIYTQAYTAHKTGTYNCDKFEISCTGLSILRPMYYEYRTVPEAMTYGDTQVKHHTCTVLLPCIVCVMFCSVFLW